MDRSERRRLRESADWVFDLDNTLYPASSNLFAAIDRRMNRFVADFLSLEMAEARNVQKRLFQEYGTTMNGLMCEHGLEPEAFLADVHEIDLTPITPEPRLRQSLSALAGRKIIFTNASRSHAERVLRRLDLADIFDAIFDITDAGYIPKPQAATYRKLTADHGIDPRAAVMVEDIAKNLIPAHAMGMTTVWVPAGTSWSRAQSSGGHIHHTAENLADWLCNMIDG